MKITFLGSGSAFVRGDENYHSNVLIENNGKKMLYDAGTTINDALYMNETNVLDIDNVFISHLHGDHSGGLEFVGFKTYFSTFPFGQKKVEVISSPQILDGLWNNQLKASMNTLRSPCGFLDFFDKREFNSSKIPLLKVNDLTIEPVKTIHAEMESYGIYIKESSVFITGDSCFTPEHLSKYFEEAKIIFHDCEFKEYDGGYHAQFRQLKTLPPEIKGKMFLYHFILEERSFDGLEKEVRREGFAGLVHRGMSFYLP